MRVLATVVPFALLLSLWSCDNGAVAPDACRTIESRRCELLRGCPAVPITSDDEVTRCKLFYHDQCLFGIAGPQPPGEVAQNQCMAALQKARACFDAGTDLGSCAGAPALAEGATSQTGCDAVLAPESLADCAFLLPAEEEGGGGKGGKGEAGGAGGTTGAAGGGATSG